MSNEFAFQNHFNDDGEVVDPRVAAFSPRKNTAKPGPHSPTALNNDVNRNARAVLEHDGTFTTTQGGVSRGSTAGYGNVPGGPFSSMRNHTNSRPILVSELTPESVVRVASNGLEMRLSSALGAGFIIQRPDGSYAASGNAGQLDNKKNAESNVEEKPHSDLDMDAFANSKDDEIFTEIVNSTNPGTQVSAVNELASTGEISPQLMSRIATEMGTDPAGAQERLAPALAAFQSQADDYVSERGVDPESFYAWAKENSPRELKAAMQRHGTKRSTSGYTGVIDSYVLQMDKHSPDAILNAQFGPGVTARKATGGKILVRTPQGEMPWSAAIRSGLIKLGGK